MMKPGDIRKAAGIIVLGRKVLVERSKGKAFFIHPGGKLESGETPAQALVRELMEEFQIRVSEDDLVPFDHNVAPAANSPEVDVHMDVFIVRRWQGKITPAAEVEEIAWIDSGVPADMPLGSIMRHETLPKLRAAGLID
jgi:8-oxo-dGTP diphosphatase